MYNKAFLIEYMGTKYAGWQRQKNALSVQSIIEEKLSKIYRKEVLTIGSGRTDKGVHSFGQVCNFISDKDIRCDKIMRALNTLLPDDIKIIDVEDVDIAFNSLYHAVSKTYAYKIINRNAPLAIDSNRACWIREKIDITLLKKALNIFVGEHDFASFCVTKTRKENTVRKVNRIDVTADGEKIVIVINANGFLHNMVRVIVGTAIDIGVGKREISEIENIISSRDRRSASKTATAGGLYHIKTFYNFGSNYKNEDRLGHDGEHDSNATHTDNQNACSNYKTARALSATNSTTATKANQTITTSTTVATSTTTQNVPPAQTAPLLPQPTHSSQARQLTQLAPTNLAPFDTDEAKLISRL